MSSSTQPSLEQIFRPTDQINHMRQSSLVRLPTNAFTILEPRDQEIGELYVVHKCRGTDFEAPKL